MTTALVVNRVIANETRPVFVAVHDGKGKLSFAAEPNSYYEESMVRGLRKSSTDLDAEEAGELIEMLHERFAADYRSEILFGEKSLVVRQAELLLRRWGAV